MRASPGVCSGVLRLPSPNRVPRSPARLQGGGPETFEIAGLVKFVGWRLAAWSSLMGWLSAWLAGARLLISLAHLLMSLAGAY